MFEAETGSRPVQAATARLAVNCARPEGPQRSSVLLLGNAYGVMPYVEPLGRLLAGMGHRTYWFPYRGQAGVPGVLSFGSALEDIAEAVACVRKETTEPLVILAHCFSSLAAARFLGERRHGGVDGLIVYGLLANPLRRRAASIPRLIESGVRFDFTEADWSLSAATLFRAVTVPVLFCHARDSTNRMRASVDELSAIARATTSSEVEWFEEGYDENLTVLPTFARYYDQWLRLLATRVVPK